MSEESTSSSVIIRSYQPSDLSACKEIFVTTHRLYNNPMSFVNNVLQTDMADIEKNYLQIPNGHWWVAVSTDDNRILGQIAVLPYNIAKLYHGDGDDGIPKEEYDYTCELLRMAVAPDTQRKGLGSKLLSTLINFAREKGYRQVHVTTLTHMKQACTFYEKNGFIKGQIDRFPVIDDSTEEHNDSQNPHSSPDLVVFKSKEAIPKEDLQLMTMPPRQAKFIYVQHYFLSL